MNFRKFLQEERVRSLPLKEPAVVDSHTLVRAAIAAMRTKSLGCAVILGPQQQPLGVFTEHAVVGLLEKSVPLDSTAVSACADPEFHVVKLDDPIAKVWSAVQSGARFVCVVDDQQQLVGLTGQRGLAEFVCECFAREIAVQRLSSPQMKTREGA
ncbi:MAG: CBS domain-containing protein [Planctomycetales bacterium]|nr:CBS domain-containing protein [Planctomycetales bacterium]